MTPPLLDLLDKLTAPSTFFLLVNQCRSLPVLAREIASRGHEVALHGFDHSRLTEMSSAQAVATLTSAKHELEDLVGRPVSLYRPPYGSQTVRSYRATRRSGLHPVVWSADAEDWVDGTVDEVVGRALRTLQPGGILLFHERLEPDPRRGAPATSFDRCAVMRGVITGCRELGLEPQRVTDLVTASSPVASAWFRP